jgi:membrane protease YdiL (CAAX protease family)
MLNKFRSLAYKYAIPAAFIIFVLFDLFIHGVGRLLSLLPESVAVGYISEIIMIALPIALVFVLGFAKTFKKGNFFKGILYLLPFIVLQLVLFVRFLANNVGNPDAKWNPLSIIILGVFSIVCVGIREECLYRATFQNIVAKKYANSVKGIWITVIVGSVIFGLCHISNLFFGVHPISVLSQVINATLLGVLFGAVYLRSGSIWSVVVVHALTDISGLASSTFLRNVSDIQDFNQLSISWGSIAFHLIYVAWAIFLLRPSKCKEIYKNLCFADEEPKSAENA